MIKIANRKKEQGNNMRSKTRQKVDAERVKLEKERIVTGVLMNGYGWGKFYVLVPPQV